MRVGEGAANFILDCHDMVSKDEMNRRHKAGEYGKLRQSDMVGWLTIAGRK